jgi:Family of unknown function (DUF695)
MEDNRGWILAQRQTDRGLSLIRIQKLEAAFPFGRYPERLNVIWSFRDMGPDETPSDEESAAMASFENRICAYIEETRQAILCVVFTEPGYREYVFHCDTTDSFLEALSEIPQEQDRYPIEIHHETDANGDFYKSYARKLIKTS